MPFFWKMRKCRTLWYNAVQYSMQNLNIDHQQPRTQAQITKNRHTTVFLYRSVAKLSERSPSTPAGLLSLATDLYKNIVVYLFLVICAWVRGCW